MGKKHVIIYSHGFGVEKDDRGLFTDIANAIPAAEHIMFDYNEVNKTDNELTVASMQIQTRKLKTKFEEAKTEYPEALFDLICHSQGCVVAGLAKLQPVRKVLMLCPPSELNSERMTQHFSNRPGVSIDTDGISRIPRKDGSTTLVPAIYWASIDSLNPIRLYNRLSVISDEVLILTASDDDVIGIQNFDETDEKIALQTMQGNHNFSGDDRPKLVKFVKDHLSV